MKIREDKGWKRSLKEKKLSVSSGGDAIGDL